MKVSLSWIFDHINASLTDYSIEDIIVPFNQKTAEIEHYYPVSLPLEKLAVATTIINQGSTFKVTIPEWKKEAALPSRKELLGQDASFLVYQDPVSQIIEWATYQHLCLNKQDLLPAFFVTEEEKNGAWKKQVEKEDIIIEVDNKSLTHRPDMWGHRGFAREIAAFLQKPLKEESNFITSVPLKLHHEKAEATASMPFSIENKIPSLVSRFCGIYLEKAKNRPSPIALALRLLRVETRPINAFVDLTNYVMLDWGQPLHAFDATSIAKKTIIVRQAHEQESLELLDSKTIKLNRNDLIVADAHGPLALAGIMGGSSSAVKENSSSLFIEAATFDAATIRKSALHHKTRTEASARFEKTLDSAQPPQALMRFIFLAHAHQLIEKIPHEIISFGKGPKSVTLVVPHHYFEKKLGISLEVDQVIQLLKAIEFELEYSSKTHEYAIVVPSFRSSKDIKAPEDILEEVARLYGFKNIQPNLPYIVCRPRPNYALFKLRKIKDYLAYGAAMTEQQNYSLYDESILERMQYVPQNFVSIQNPISQNHVRLVTMLMPHLLKNVAENYRMEPTLRFFEVGRTWHKQQSEVIEKKRCAGIFFDRFKKVDFYEAKYHLDTLFKSLNLAVEWRKSQNPSYAPWTNPNEMAQLYHGETLIGQCGKIKSTFWPLLDIPPESDAFTFGFDLDYIYSVEEPLPQYVAPSKFQEVTFDISCFVPLSLETSVLEKNLYAIDPLIVDVSLVDFFEKKEWQDKRSLAFRIMLVHPAKTLEKEEIEAVRLKAISTLEKLGATLRI